MKARAGSAVRANSDAIADLIEEVFAPAVVAAAEHAHDLAAGVERKRTWLAEQNHVIDFRKHSVAFSAIAGVAAGDEIFPR